MIQMKDVSLTVVQSLKLPVNNLGNHILENPAANVAGFFYAI